MEFKSGFGHKTGATQTFLWPWLLENHDLHDHLSGERQSSTTDCGSFSTNSLTTTVYTIYTLCLRWVGRILFHGVQYIPWPCCQSRRALRSMALVPSREVALTKDVLKFGSSDEALNAQSPRMGFATFTPAIFKPLEDRGWASRECAAAVLVEPFIEGHYKVSQESKSPREAKWQAPGRPLGTVPQLQQLRIQGPLLHPTSTCWGICSLEILGLRFMDS